MVTNVVPTGLHHDGRVQHDEPHFRVGAGRFDLRADAILDPRMHHRLKLAAFAGVTENHLGKKTTLYLLFVVEQSLAPAPDHLFLDGRFP